MKGTKRVPAWLVVLASVLATLVGQQVVIRAALLLSPPGPARVDQGLADRIEAHFKTFGMAEGSGGASDRQAPRTHGAMHAAQAFPVAPGGPGQRDPVRRPDDADRLFEAVASTDRFMRGEGFLPCPGGFVLVPGYATTATDKDGKKTLFAEGTGVEPPKPRSLVIMEPGRSGQQGIGDTVSVVLLRYRLRSTDEAECSIVFVLDRLQGRLGAGYSLDGQRNGQWGRLDFQTSSFAMSLLSESGGSPTLKYEPPDAPAPVRGF